MRRTGLAVSTVVTALTLLPSAALAGTTVYAGPPRVGGLTKQFKQRYNPDVNAFFSQRVTINAGDKVTFKLNGFHTVDLPGTTGQDLPLLVPGATVTGVNDAAGSPFWFNGKVPSIGLNPALFAPSGPKVYNGTTRIDSGLASGPKAKPLVVQFTKPGVYKFYCDVHPGMVGYVVVKPKGQAVPTAAQAAAALKRQARTAVKTLKALVSVKQPADTVHLGESGPGGEELYGMFPATLSVNPGTVVTFEMSKDSRETHTATFGPIPLLTTLAKGFQGASFPAQGVYPSDPAQPLTISPTSHGDGFANLGALDNDPGTPTIRPSGKIDFTTAGVYHFVCLIHPWMHGTIIVK
ncbi:MAG TPA: hypothetical protein VIK04_15435 [Solirubrobacteraceae bacterium]